MREYVKATGLVLGAFLLATVFMPSAPAEAQSGQGAGSRVFANIGSGGSLTAGTTNLTTTAAVLSTTAEMREIIVQCDPDNGADCLIGTSAAQVMQLDAGQSITLYAWNITTIYAKMVSGTGTVNWIYRN